MRKHIAAVIAALMVFAGLFIAASPAQALSCGYTREKVVSQYDKVVSGDTVRVVFKIGYRHCTEADGDNTRDIEYKVMGYDGPPGVLDCSPNYLGQYHKGLRFNLWRYSMPFEVHDDGAGRIIDCDPDGFRFERVNYPAYNEVTKGMALELPGWAFTVTQVRENASDYGMGDFYGDDLWY